MFGRQHELATLRAMLDAARGGQSGALVVHGEAGIGKTRLLDFVTAEAVGVSVMRLVGIESEMRLGFAALHQLLSPLLADIDPLPAPQSRALTAAFGLTDDGPPDVYLVGLAALTLLTATAATGDPLVVVVDDAQWLDAESATVIGFVGRRLRADRVCLWVAVRDETAGMPGFEGLPSLRLGPLSQVEAGELLDSTVAGMVGGRVVDQVRERLLEEAAGNPLAIAEFTRGLTAEQREGLAPLADPLAIEGRLEAHFGRQVAALPARARTLLLVLAAEPTRDVDLVWRAGVELGFDDDAAAAAEQAGLLVLGPPPAFRHPLIRSAVYQGASPAERRSAHAALADACETDARRDQRAWHRAAATRFPDEDVAAELEGAARRAAARGSAAASAALFLRAAGMSPDRERRANRLFAAASAEMTSGRVTAARSNLKLAFPDLIDPVLRARARQLEGMIDFLASDGSSGASVSLVVDAARELAPAHADLARDVMLDALVMARICGEFSPMPAHDVARVALSFTLPPDLEPTAADLVLEATATLYADGIGAAEPLLRRAVAAVLADPVGRRDARLLSRACSIALAVSDHDALEAVAGACADVCRDTGNIRVLSEAVHYQKLGQLSLGALDAAEDLAIEQREIQAVLQRQSRPSDALDLVLQAWRSPEDQVRATAGALTERSPGVGIVELFITSARIVLELGLGNYRAAAALHHHDWSADFSPMTVLRAADLIEAHVRCADKPAARAALAYLEDRARATASEFDRGLLARGSALIADGDDAESWYLDSVNNLEHYGARLHAARSRLVYGEWLRRRKRRRDARAQLESARSTFEALGAATFADRARVELLATGGQARKRVDSTRYDLTPQEWQIARMAAGGATNPQIAARLFISASTVDYHLRKVYRKLDVTSRHKIATVLPLDDSRPHRD